MTIMQDNLLKSSNLMDNITALTTIQSDLSSNKNFYITESNVSHITEFLRRNIDYGAFDAPKMEHALKLICNIFHATITNKDQDCAVIDSKSLLKTLIDILKLSSDTSTASFSSFFSCKCYEYILKIFNDEGLLANIIKHELLQCFSENIGSAIKVYTLNTFGCNILYVFNTYFYYNMVHRTIKRPL